ncbi:hypothetical protein [Barrientosiimonas endolithica]|uniref:hypothetical protein n=1 Tax=Barrientosiimonas endolithica TaxID=1535208 RepID=UPI003305B878
MIASTAQQALHALPTSAADPGQPGGIAGFTVDMMEALGAPGAGLAVALENLFPRSRARSSCRSRGSPRRRAACRWSAPSSGRRSARWSGR